MVTDVTRLTATLPQLDVEIVRCEETAPAAQVLMIQVRATPTFRALAEHLSHHTLLPAAPLAFASPLAWWANALRAAWLPWLTLPLLAAAADRTPQPTSPAD